MFSLWRLHICIFASLPPLFPPTLFTVSLTLSFTHAPSLLTRLSLAPSPRLSSSFPLSFPISPLLPPSLSPLLPLLPREDWLANLAVYPQCLVVPRRRGQCRQHEDTTKRQLRYLKMELSGQMSKQWERRGEMEDRLSFLLTLNGVTAGDLCVCVNLCVRVCVCVNP